jgi:hypothetical protein
MKMKITGRIVSLLAVTMLGAGVRAADKVEAAGQPALPLELKAFQRWIGSWSYEATFFKSEWTPEEKRVTGKFACTWALGGRYLEERGSDGNQESHLKLCTFDEQRRVYRAWWFSSTGNSNVSDGTWDEATQTFKWTAMIEQGRTVTGRQHFVSDDVVEASVRVTDDTGKEFFRIEYKSQRLPEPKR